MGPAPVISLDRHAGPSQAQPRLIRRSLRAPSLPNSGSGCVRPLLIQPGQQLRP